MSCGRRSKARGAVRGLAAVAAVSAVVAASARASAAPVRAGETSGKFQMRESSQASGPAEGARARVREGDCKGALALFDEALRTSIDPTLHRDRGLCHDKLGDVYPAIDDYRAYVFAAPDEPDVDTIRQRISELQGNAPPAEGDEESTNGTQASIERVSHGDVIARPTSAKRATLKGGSGVGLGAYFGAGALLFNDPSSTKATYEKIGLQLRADLAPVHAFVLEGGYFHLDDKTVNHRHVSPAGAASTSSSATSCASGSTAPSTTSSPSPSGGTLAHFSETQTGGRRLRQRRADLVRPDRARVLPPHLLQHPRARPRLRARVPVGPPDRDGDRDDRQHHGNELGQLGQLERRAARRLRGADFRTVSA